MIDLHMHSRYSDDGEFTPSELAAKCAQKRIRVMSVTDHNCAKANADAAKAAAKEGITYIPGIEIDCTYRDINFHILGYGIDFLAKDYEKVEENLKDQCMQASLDRLAKTQALGFEHVTKKAMQALSQDNYWQENWSGEMFAEVLLTMPEYADHPLLTPYRPGGGRSDNPLVNFYWDYYAQEKPCYVKIHYPAMEEIIDMIHRSHGICVIAHPGVNLQGKEFLLDDIVSLGIDGIEAFSSYHGKEQAQFYYQKAQEKHILCTCGSDYHGKTKPSIEIGQHHCPISYEERLKEALLK